MLAATVLGLLVTIAATGDVLGKKIPNVLTAATALAFVPCALFSGVELSVAISHIATGLSLFFLGYVLFLSRLFGGGDAKLIAATGLWFGYPDAILFVLLAAVAGGVLAVAMIMLSLLRFEAGIRNDRALGLFRNFTPSLPYGFAIAAGAILALPQSSWLTATTP